jgi:hypothetical protein
MGYIELLNGSECVTSPGGFMVLFELERLADPEPHLHAVKPGTGARAMGHSAWAAPGPEPGGQLPGLLAELGWLATKGTVRVLWRSTFLVPSLLAAAAREMYPRPRDSEQPAAPDPAGPAHENGAGVVVDLAAYRQHARLARAVRLAQNAQPPGWSP